MFWPMESWKIIICINHVNNEAQRNDIHYSQHTGRVCQPYISCDAVPFFLLISSLQQTFNRKIRHKLRFKFISFVKIHCLTKVYETTKYWPRNIMGHFNWYKSLSIPSTWDWNLELYLFKRKRSLIGNHIFW